MAVAMEETIACIPNPFFYVVSPFAHTLYPIPCRVAPNKATYTYAPFVVRALVLSHPYLRGGSVRSKAEGRGAEAPQPPSPDPGV